MKTHYHILNISPRASDEDVRQAWRALALRWHPDRNPANRAQAQQVFILINRAYTMLKTKPQREAYNRSLLKVSPLRKLGSSQSKQPDSRIRGNDYVALSFLTGVREILWPFATNEQARHG